MKKILIDTNAYSSFFKGDKQIKKEIEEADIIYMSVVVLGELYSAFRNGDRYNKNKKELDEFLDRLTVEVVKINKNTAEIYGEIKDSLKKVGKPVSINDIWIASNAMETGSIIVTYDTDFLKIPGLRVWDRLRN